MKFLGFISLFCYSLHSYADEGLLGKWVSDTGVLCEASGEVIRRLEVLEFKDAISYARSLAFRSPGMECLYSISGMYTQNSNEIVFAKTEGNLNCNGKPEKKVLEELKMTFSIATDDTLTTLVPSSECGNVKTVYRRVK